jgi:hypothetical protein
VTPVTPPAEPSPAPSPITWRQRVLEILPGLATWAAVVAPVILALYYPEQVVIGIICLDAYWLVRSAIVVLGIKSTFDRFEIEKTTDWWQLCLELDADEWTDPDGATYDPRQLYHAALIPTYTEKYEVLQATLNAWDVAHLPGERKVVAIITRTTDVDGIENVRRLQEEFAGRFHRFWHILDPVLPGIVVGKSAAMAYGGPELFKLLQREGIDPRKVIVTDLDSDFRVHPQYLARVTWDYCRDRDRDFRVYQPIPMFHNNIWRVPAAVHVMASASTQWQMFLHARPHRLVTFASYSASMHLVRDVGYWDPHVIQASQYNQIKRWAWGVSDIPFVFLNVLTHPEIPLWLRGYRFALLQFNHLLWVAMPLLIFFGASLPTYFMGLTHLLGVHFPGYAYDYNLTAQSNQLGSLAGGILTVTLANVAVLIYIEEKIVPPRPHGWALWRRVKSYIEILAYPVYGLLFSVLPALEAQTRLMVGNYLEYRVTEKE